MYKLFFLIASMFLLVGCIESVALLGPATGAGNGKIVQSSLKSAVSYGIKKQTGSTPMQHALAFAEKKNPNKKKERCISFIEKTNSEACMIVKQQISLVQSTALKKISNTQINLKDKAQVVFDKSLKTKNDSNKLNKSIQSTKKFALALKTKIKEYDAKWLSRIEKSSIKRQY